jgi:hypothetical protein
VAPAAPIAPAAAAAPAVAVFAAAPVAPPAAAPSAPIAPVVAALEAAREIDRRKSRVLRLGDFIGPANPKLRSYDILASTAARGCGPADWPAYMASLPNVRPDDSPDVEPIEMFALPPLVRYLYQFGHCMSAAQKQQLQAGLVRKQRLLSGGTTNHAIMRATSWYLLAQYFPAARWTDVQGKTYSSPELMAALKLRLADRTVRIFKAGHDEWLSPTYAMVDLFPMLNLVDFAADASVRKLAGDEATLEVSVLRTHSFHGVLVPPLTRRNFDQRNAPGKLGTYVPSIAQQILWYYYGEPEMSDYDLQSRKEPFYITMLAQSKWQPPGAALTMGSATGALRTVTPAFADWGKATPASIYGDSFITPDFAIGTGNGVFDPSWYNDHTQTFAILLRSKDAKNAIECYHPYWGSNSGEDGWGSDRWSPFQQTLRYDDSSVVMLFDIPQRDPWVYDQTNRFFMTRNNHAEGLLQMFQCRIPRSFDQVMAEPNWVFARHGDVFVAIATLQGSNEFDGAPARITADYHVMKVREPRSALFFRVEKARADMDFARFRQQVRSQVPSYDKATSAVSVTAADGTPMRMAFQLRQQSNSKYWDSLPAVTKGGERMTFDVDTPVDAAGIRLRSGVLLLGAPSAQFQVAPEPIR